MMYPRLKLLHQFLDDDGVILISIDDDEAGHLRLLLDEIFGRWNFIANVVWQKRYVSNVTAKYLSDMHDHIFVYGREAQKVTVNLVPRTEEQKKDYKNHDDDPRGPWRAQDLSASKPYKAGQFTITGPQGDVFDPPPNRYWRMNREQYDQWLADDRITFGKSGKGRPMLKRFLTEAQQGLTPNTWWSHDFAGHNKEATLEVKKLFGGNAPFDTPKPVKLLTRVMQIFSDPDSLILDSFAGSGTTGQAVLELNREDGGRRRCILVEMEETIARDVTAKRLAKVIEQGQAAAKTRTADGAAVETRTEDAAGGGEGFRYCVLGEPLFAADGTIHEPVTWRELAHHVFFSETGVPLGGKTRGEDAAARDAAAGEGACVGEHDGRRYYLLFNGVLGDRSVNGGNVLTHKSLDACGGDKPSPPRTIYGEACRLSGATLRRLGVTFKQLPYDVEGG